MPIRNFRIWDRPAVRLWLLLWLPAAAATAAGPIIIDHTCTDLSRVPSAWILQAKSSLRVTYGHTSHGSQLISGIETFMGAEGSLYYFTKSDWSYNEGIFLNDYSPDGDLGNPDRTTWAARTRELLTRAGGCDRNVVMWSWCGQADTSDPADIATYLTLMDDLEQDFPNVHFVYMTGHLAGSGTDGDLNQRNEQIRSFCRTHNKVLFDFADIESYDPGGATNFMEQYANDGCFYDTSGDDYPDDDNGSNWAYNWIQAHPGDPLSQLAADCASCAHSEDIWSAKLNCILKGRAFWWLMARLAGWSGSSNGVDFNGDGQSDLLWRHQSTGQNVAWYMNGVSKTKSASVTLQADLNWELAAAADFNADGQTDLLWRHLATGKNLVWYMKGVSKAGSASLPTQADMNYQLVQCADLNNDGKTDVLWRHISTGSNVAWYMNGVSRTQAVSLPVLGNMNWSLSGCGDFNHDARTDILWRNRTTGENAVWYMQGKSRTGIAYLPSLTTLSWAIVDCADFNGDGKPDILWRNRTTGQNAVWYMNGVARTGTAYMPTQSDMNWELKN